MPRSISTNGQILLIDISNSFTKFSLSTPKKTGAIHRFPTRDLMAAQFRTMTDEWQFERAVLASVVPRKSEEIRRALKVPILEVSASVELGVGIRYPNPETIGADRLANAAATAAFFPLPAVVVDFGTAVTFDVISADGFYVGGVIAPGVSAVTETLHHQTALLPLIELSKPRRVVGKSTIEAMMSGAVYGYVGMIREILEQIGREAFFGAKPCVIATGGDAVKLSKLLPLFDAVKPSLTLDGLRLIAALNPIAKMKENARQTGADS